ncbi:MAG: PEP/pyruvate-binding domain-containing protein [Chloroflexota bacterium]
MNKTMPQVRRNHLTTAQQMDAAVLENYSSADVDQKEAMMESKADQLAYVIDLGDSQATLELVGGKGASLARLLAAGLPVPGGFNLTTHAYREFVQANELMPVILEALQGIDPARPSTLEQASEAIGQAFTRAPIPADLANAIVQAYASLPGQNPAVAVRSSATAEDLPEASFAGQQETYLNVSGAGAVLDAVRRCWASLWTGRAISYRARTKLPVSPKQEVSQGIQPDQVALAVVVQLLVPAEAAGILFTANPVNGRRDQAMISAAWGLGEAVVGGLVTPDNLVVDKTSGEVLQRDTADKQVMTVRVNGGTHEEPVPDALRQVPVLSDAAAAELARLGVQIEQLYQMTAGLPVPMDIEWAWLDGAFAILQARPITALPEPPAAVPAEYAPPAEWPLPRPNSQCIRASIVELMPNPLSPLFATWGFAKVNRSLKEFLGLMAVSPDALPYDIMVTVNGYAYQDYGMTAIQWVKIMKMIFKFPDILRNGVRRWQETYLPHYKEVVGQWSAQALHDLSSGELVQAVDQVLDAFSEHLVSLMASTMGPTAGSEMLFTRVYEKTAQREGDPPAAAFLLGFDSLPILGDKALYDLALWCRKYENLASFLVHTPAQSLAALLKDNLLPEDLEADGTSCPAEWESWKIRFCEYLERYGYSIYDMDFARPLPMDDPAPMLETLKLFITAQADSPYERQTALAERRQQAVASALFRLKGVKRWAFEKALKFAQTQAPYREDGIAEIGLGYPQVRRMLLELGRRFARAGVIAEAGDIYWLEQAELQRAVTALEEGSLLESLVEQVRQRKDLQRAYQQLTPPPQLPPKQKMLGMDVGSMLAVGSVDSDGDILKGVGASPGEVSAPAKVLHGPQDFDQMRPGDVLVASITTPAWTPLFAQASAVVTDIGGPLSHSSIVAREYGIPAVLGTGAATRRIRSGQVVTVDGSAGTVTLSGAEER